MPAAWSHDWHNDIILSERDSKRGSPFEKWPEGVGVFSFSPFKDRCQSGNSYDFKSRSMHLTKYNSAKNKGVVETSLCADIITGSVATQPTATSKQVWNLSVYLIMNYSKKMLQGLNFSLFAIWPSPKFFLAKCFLLNVTRLLWSKIMKFNQHHFEQNCTFLCNGQKCTIGYRSHHAVAHKCVSPTYIGQFTPHGTSTWWVHNDVIPAPPPLMVMKS